MFKPGNVAMRTGANKGRELRGEVYTGTEVRSLLNVCSRIAPTGIRDRALLTLVYRSGLRISEALDLLPGDVNTERGTVHVRAGKRFTERWAGIDDGALAVLERWLDARKQLGLTGRRVPLFCTLAGGPMSYTAADNMLKRRAEKAWGKERRAHFHGLRHSMAVEWDQEGATVAEIGSQLGQSRLSTTAIYLEKLNPRSVQMARKRAWSAD